MLSISHPTRLVLSIGLVLWGASAEAQDKSKKADAATKKVVVELQKLFKLWDANKDRFADQDELKKFATSVKPKAPKNQPKEDADAGTAAVEALISKLDPDKDQKFSQAEFDTWAALFARDFTEIMRLQFETARIQQELAKLEALSQRSGNVTAGDGIFQDSARRGIIQYQLQLKDLAAQLDKIKEEGGHAGYQEFLQRELLRRVKL
jgi:hypothetical protein